MLIFDNNQLIKWVCVRQGIDAHTNNFEILLPTLAVCIFIKRIVTSFVGKQSNILHLEVLLEILQGLFMKILNIQIYLKGQ